MSNEVRTVAQVLREAKAVIPTPAQWTRKVAARDSRGNRVTPRNERAVRWCAMGAIEKVAPGDGLAALEWAAIRALRPHMDDEVPTFNDSHTHAEVLAAFDAAIAEQEAAL